MQLPSRTPPPRSLPAHKVPSSSAALSHDAHMLPLEGGGRCCAARSSPAAPRILVQQIQHLKGAERPQPGPDSGLRGEGSSSQDQHHLLLLRGSTDKFPADLEACGADSSRGSARGHSQPQPAKSRTARRKQPADQLLHPALPLSPSSFSLWTSTAPSTVSSSLS